MRMRLLFADKATRDREFARLREAGEKVRKGSVRNQLLHPIYVEDRKTALTQADCGFGNTLYKTHFAVLYEIYFDQSGFGA